jgi:geranylgeranyl diphosphate synthase type II
VNSSASDLQEFLTGRRARVDAALERFLPAPPHCPPSISDAMRYSVFAGGKRFRPLLTLAAADATARAMCDSGAGDDLERRCAEAEERAMPAACALELIHTYSLIHDDLPAMDDDTLRRGRPTSHIVFGEGVAILAGDALLTEAFGLLAREPRGDDPDLASRKLRTMATIAESAGAPGMVGGQAIDLQMSGKGFGTSSKNPGSPPEEALFALRDMHERKTGALIRAAAVSGAVMAGAGDPLIRAVDDYATHLGLAFQIVDDILDVEGASGELGKTAGKDAAAGKPTYVSHYGLAESRRLAAMTIARAHDVLACAGIPGWLGDIADWVHTRRS